jgi:hypothetical protein
MAANHSIAVPTIGFSTESYAEPEAWNAESEPMLPARKVLWATVSLIALFIVALAAA